MSAAVFSNSPPPVTDASTRAPYRLTELLLLVPAVAVGALAYAQVDLARSGALPHGYWGWLTIGVLAAVVAHVAVQVLAPWSDQVLLPTVVALNGLGLALIYRLDLAAILDVAGTGESPTGLAAVDQVVWTWLGVGLFVLVLVVVREPRWLQRFTYTAMLLGLALIVLPLVPHLGVTINGARIWIRLGGLSFQPAEVAKLVLIVFFAGYLVMKRDVLSLARSRVLGIDFPRGRDLGPILGVWLASVGVLVFERDLGTSVLFFGLFVAMLYVATERVGWLVIGVVLAALGIAVTYSLFGHVRVRFDVWLHPFADASGSGYQSVQALFGMADGGILGSGIAQGHPDLVPYANSDFITAALGELLGVTGFMAMLVLYAVVVARGLSISLAARDPFGRLLAFGLAFVLGLQVFVVVGGVTNLIPLTGLTTPFLSAGGSSLVANWALVALLLRVSDSARRPVVVPVALDQAETQVFLSVTITVRRMALIVGVLFLCLLVQANRIQVVKADDLNNRPGNTRSIIDSYGQQRGSIIVGATQVARSVDTGDSRLRYERRYSRGLPYAPATGFYSIVYGATGIERQENALLSGDDPRLIGTQLQDLISGGSRQGASVRLTLDAAAQQAAWDGIKQYNGAVVAIEPSTGRILALATSPSYDPNPLSSNNPAENREAWERLNADPEKPLLNRPLAATYPPGSIFKVVTASAALSSGEYTMETEIPAPAVLDLPGTTADLPNYDGRACFGGQVTLEQALQISCNTAFANVGLHLGDDVLREQAELFGFNHSFDVPMPAATSVFPADLNAPQTAQAAIGQFDVRATALQIAMVGAALANGGVVMNPYLVDQVLAPDLSVLSRGEPSEFGRAVSPEIAQEMTDMLVNVVQNGTGQPAQIPGVLVAGKTGTAQTAEGRAPHAWFLAYAPAENAQVAVAVVVENGGNLGSEATGGRLAAPIAKAVMEAVLR